MTPEAGRPRGGRGTGYRHDLDPRRQEGLATGQPDIAAAAAVFFLILSVLDELTDDVFWMSPARHRVGGGTEISGCMLGSVFLENLPWLERLPVP